MLGRVLVLSASAGAGHLRAAEAIEKAIRLRGLASEVQHLDVLKYTNKVFRHLYSKAYIDLVNNAPRFWDGCMTISTIPPRTIRFVWLLIG